VALISMHAAKGLEFPVVFVAGCEEGLIPSRAAEDREEERRLLYVAMTRARQRLFLTWARRRRLFGKTEEREMSPFVRDIEGRWLENESAAKTRTRRGPDQMTLF
jgi:superfamily I DNA/RNA helicase